MARRKSPLPKKLDPAAAAKEAKRKEEMNKRIDEFLAFSKEHPSVHDRMTK